MGLSKVIVVFSCLATLVTCRQPVSHPQNNTAAGVKACTGDEFRCDTSRCVPEFARCDRTPDCLDGTDERNCNTARQSRDVSCEVEPNDGVGPVCGSDGVTYNNRTALRCANNTAEVPIEMVYRGKCEDPCWAAISPLAAQEKEEERVCGSDLTIYPSATVLACVNLHSNKANISKVAMEKCGSKKLDPCLLLAYVSPRKICGSDNVTYNNVWHMICTANMYKLGDRLKLQHEGECDIECPYSPIYKPVCSTIDYVYANIEALKCRQTLSPYIKNELLHLGLCARHVNQNPCYVDNAYNPVCASNGRTYSSPQYARCLKNANPGLSVLHSGPCSVDEVMNILGNTTEACDIAAHHYEWNPVCANNNVTYGNPFIFICSAMNKTTEDLLVSHTGECGSFDYCRLEGEGSDDEVCGNDGITYPKLHALYCAQSTKRHLQLSHTGPCKTADDPCLFRGSPFLDNKGSPMCASDGVTYVSPQAVWCRTKTDSGVAMKHDGECF